MNLICGINPVLEALAAGTRHFDRLLIVKGLRNQRVSEAIARASQMGIPLRFESRETLDRMAGNLPHQGLIAVVSAKPTIGLEELVSQARQPALLVVLDGVEDPRNLGAILRTAEAAGADGVVLPERHSAGLSETVSRASAGALEYVRVARVGNLVQALGALKAQGIWVVGLDAAGTERWDAVDLRRPVAVVLGGEGRGIRRLVRETCDHLVSVPLFGHVASLNVSVAAGIALYEVVRQRGSVPSHVRPIPLRPAPVHRQVLGPEPGDPEDDPGRTDRSDWGSEPEDEPEWAGQVRIDEEDGWSGPTLLKPLEGPHRGRGRRRPRDGERGGRPAVAAPADRRAGGPAGAGAGNGSPGRRRRRRSKRRLQDGPPGPPRPGAGGVREAPSPPDPGSMTPEGSPPAGGQPPGGGRRRRRRRRRSR